MASPTGWAALPPVGRSGFGADRAAAMRRSLQPAAAHSRCPVAPAHESGRLAIHSPDAVEEIRRALARQASLVGQALSSRTAPQTRAETRPQPATHQRSGVFFRFNITLGRLTWSGRVPSLEPGAHPVRFHSIHT